MKPREKADLAAAWIRLQHVWPDSAQSKELFWSFDLLHDLTHDDPEIAWEVILLILEADASNRIQENLSAGPLEDLLVLHGSAFMERVEREAARNPHFRHLLGGVWKNDMTDEIWGRVQACWDRRGWDANPA